MTDSPVQSSCNIDLEDIRVAQQRLAAGVTRTPLVIGHAVSARADTEVYLKLENLQRTGAFKVRGALNKVASLSQAERERGLICASSGNHGIGVTYAARQYRLRSIVVLPEGANPHKTSLLRELGAEVVLFGTDSNARQQKVDELSEAHGYTQVHPFADPEVIAGQGTVGLEIVEDLAEMDEVYVPIGGGGLISGIATAIKQLRPHVRVIGVEPEHAATMTYALQKHAPAALPLVNTIADGLAAAKTEQLNFSIASQYVDRVILVKDYQIVEAALLLIERERIFVEPSGAASVAGLLANANRQGTAVAVISGGNVTLEQIAAYREAFGL